MYILVAIIHRFKKEIAVAGHFVFHHGEKFEGKLTTFGNSRDMIKKGHVRKLKLYRVSLRVGCDVILLLASGINKSAETYTLLFVPFIRSFLDFTPKAIVEQ